MQFYSVYILNVEKETVAMNSSLENVLALIGILMFFLAIKTMLKIRKIKKTTILVREKDE